MSRSDKEQILMEDNGWDFEDDVAVKHDSRGMEIGRQGDALWDADLKLVRSIM